MVTFEEAWAATAAAEGGYSNHPSDPGGETMYGVTARVARSAGYTGPMRELSRENAGRIYRALYWDPLRLDDISEISGDVARELFDTNVNLYRGAAGTFLQRALNVLGADPPVKVDGDIGGATVDALRVFFTTPNPRRPAADRLAVMLRLLNGLQLADYVRQAEAQPQKRDFLYGWVRARVVI